MPEIKLCYEDDSEITITDASVIEKFVDEIEQYTRGLDEFEIASRNKGKETFTIFVTLYNNSPDDGIAGWLVYRDLKSKRDRAIYCIKEKEVGAFYQPVSYWGCPKEILSSAVFSKTDITRFVESMILGTKDPCFVIRSMSDVYRQLATPLQ